MTDKILIGLSIIADCMDFRNMNRVVSVLGGSHDAVLLHAFYHSAHRTVAQDNPQETDPAALNGLKNFKDFLRDAVQAVLREAERQDQLERQATKKKVLQELAESNRPHVMGTVAEIATKYGVSKSEVRRRKADGTLDELLTFKTLQGS